MVNTSTVVLESQLDWLTCAVHSRDKTHDLAKLALELAQGEAHDGDNIKPFHLNGYVGYRSGRVRYGEKENAGLIQLSGDLAANQLDTMVALADSITRVDVAITISPAVPLPQLGEEAYSQAVDWHREHPRSALPSATHDANGGWTTYVGHRGSDFYFRLYEKGAESRARGDKDSAARYLDCWRYELECKGPPTAPLARRLSAAADRPAYCQSLLHEYVTAHGIRPAFEPNGNRVLRPGFRRRSDYRSRLGWLARSVAPAIATMLDQGDREEIVKALGLD